MYRYIFKVYIVKSSCFNCFYEFFFCHEYLSWLGTELGSDNSSIIELIHNSCGSIKSNFK